MEGPFQNRLGTIDTVAKVSLALQKTNVRSVFRSVWKPVYWSMEIPHSKGPGPGSVPRPSMYVALPSGCSGVVIKVSLTTLPTFVALFESSFWTLPGSVYEDDDWATGRLDGWRFSLLVGIRAEDCGLKSRQDSDKRLDQRCDSENR